MELPSIFSSTLGLAHPWHISQVEVSSGQPRLDIYINCSQSIAMDCPACRQSAAICGSSEQSWHHGDFFNKEVYLHVEVPVFNCASSCGCFRVNVPWSNPGSRFVLLKDSLAPVCRSCDKAGSMRTITA